MFTSMHSMHVSKIISQIRPYIKPCCALSQLFVPLQVLTLRTSLYTYIYSQVLVYIYCRRKFRSQTSDSMDRWKAEIGRVREETRRRKRKSQKKEDPGAQKGRKVAKHGVFPMIWGSGGSKSRLAKAGGAEPAGERWKIARRCGAKQISKSKCTKHTRFGPLLEVAMSKKCTPLWREAHFQVKMYKTHHARTTFGSWDVSKKCKPLLPEAHFQAKMYKTHHARTTFGSWCLKSARRFGAKQISKSKCTKHTMCGPLLEVEMSKKWTPLWREAHFQVKMYKTHHSRTTFGSWDVEKVHAVVARSTFSSQNVQSTRGANHFWAVEMSKKCTPLWREAHFQVKMYKTHHARTTFGSWDI